ncbi:MAG: hypothetical protein FJX02_04660 [Alphaproteobacteria bacterium]|nr:hypothetical protein [Alphaproteobacteria bacterium]
MKRVLRFVGQTLTIVAITLALDFVVTATVFADLKAGWIAAERGNDDAYITTPYDHDIRPDRTGTRVWGPISYPWRADRFGFRTGACAERAPDPAGRHVFVIGDSFTEALGVSFETSFPGLIACDVERAGGQAWNLGVASYSPVIYHLKIRAAAERLGVRPSSIVIFLDLSDIDDDANIYSVDADGRVSSGSWGGWPRFKYQAGQFVVTHFSSARLVAHAVIGSLFTYARSQGRARARWAYDPKLMEKWGRRGLEVATGNMDRLAALCREWGCRLTLVVYPWPDNIAAGDRDSVQVRHWRDWAAGRGARFVDGFAPFFTGAAEETIRGHFIAGDVHFNERGHQLVFETVRKGVGGDW